MLRGDAGDDLYVFTRGDGIDMVEESAPGGVDVATFGGDIAHDQLWFSRSGNNLTIDVIGTAQRVTVVGWYESADRRLDEIRADSGYSVAGTAVDQLVQAMASLPPPAAGQLTLSQEQRDQLAPTLAATWHT
jgi:hypothetical protein